MVTTRFKELSIVEIGLLCGGLGLLKANINIYGFRGELLNAHSIEKLNSELLEELEARKMEV